ncbi:hypothetical protein CK203_026463 [Vitis vinifera]|uniref:Uncharacterized protein n=1 Tax=Vitis vinifera TaxID=29760 RepID=A0A438IVK6_VITVI|nr:hypothetical protein CK203_026463 [Vitis vinifera]
MPTCLSAILALLTFIVPLLINLTDLKFWKEADSVFQVHPINTKVVVLILLAFLLAFGIELTFHTCHLSPTCAALLHTTMVFSGSFSLASLASLLFPGALWPLLFVHWYVTLEAALLLLPNHNGYTS